MVGGIPNENPLVITAFIANFDVSRVLIDSIICYDLMYSDFFEKMGLKNEKLWPYEGSYLQAFNDIVAHPWGTSN